MRIDPNGKIGAYPAILVRKVLRHLRDQFRWSKAELVSAAGLSPGRGASMVRALRSGGLIEAAGRGLWTVTQAGRTFSSATAAWPVSRATAEKALAKFLGRVSRVNEDPYFLAKATRVVLFGSMLRSEVDRLSDVDLAVGLTAKEADFDLARVQNEQRAEELEAQGHRFRQFLERECCGYLETFRFLKGRSRVIALADYNAEKSFIIAVPHRVLIGSSEEAPAGPTARAPLPAKRNRRPHGCPF